MTTYRPFPPTIGDNRLNLDKTKAAELRSMFGDIVLQLNEPLNKHLSDPNTGAGAASTAELQDYLADVAGLRMLEILAKYGYAKTSATAAPAPTTGTYAAIPDHLLDPTAPIKKKSAGSFGPLTRREDRFI